MTTKEIGFDTKKYIEFQSSSIRERINQCNRDQVFMEFGGKPFEDHHAERVLPGYEPDCKAQLLAELLPVGKIVMVVNARDILPPPYGRTLNGRFRGDSHLRYDFETIRLIHKARELEFDIKDVVVSVSPVNPSETDKRMLDHFRENLFKEGVYMHSHFEIPQYPDTSILENAESIFSRNDVVHEVNNHLIAFSPGGGSGKFGFLLSEIYHALRNGHNPNFIKFETFPVFEAEPDHALNLAFEAATADLQNRVVLLSSEAKSMTTYDKDIENYNLLKKLFEIYGKKDNNPVDVMNNPTAMSVNKIMDGITNEDAIIQACRNEILQRIIRYTREVDIGTEKTTTLDRANEIYEIFKKKYG